MSLSHSIRPVLFVSVSALVLTAVGASPLGAQARYEPGNEPSYQQGRPDETRAYGSAYDLPAFVSVVDGYAELDRAGQSSRDIENVPLEAGDRIRTTRGRAEVLFDDGSVIAIDEHTTVLFVSATELELVRGRVRAQWQHQGTLDGLTVFTSAGQAVIRTRGDYRVSLGQSRTGEDEVELAVSRGSAELVNDQGRTVVREGTRALTTAWYAPSVPYAFSSPGDEFERWADSLGNDRYGVESVRYLPTELRYYGGVFDRHGSWHQHHSYGWVWYPRVNIGWRPYDGGRWSFVIGFGYSWVGGSRWAWPTHHHGRWDRVGSRYFWIPTRPFQRRVVGYAAPRSSYTAKVSYYQRPTAQRPPSTIRGSQPPTRTMPPTNATPVPPRAVPRGQEPRMPMASRPSIGRDERPSDRSPQPAVRSPQPAAAQPPRTAPTSPRAVPRNQQRTPTVNRPPSVGRDQQPQGRSPQPSARSPEPAPAKPPARTAPQAPRTQAPPSGSRTPSRSARPPATSSGGGGGGGGDKGQAGTAVRRRGGV